MRKHAGYRTGIAAVALFFLVFLVFPLGRILLESLFVSQTFSFANFEVLFVSQRYRYLVANSLQIAAFTTLLSGMFGVPLALLCTCTEFRGKRICLLLAVLPLLLPPFVGALGLQKLCGRFGAINVLLMQFDIPPVDWLGTSGQSGVILLQSLHFFPIFFLTYSAALRRLDWAAIEAARTLGLSKLTTFFKITLPLTVPAICAAAVLVTIGSITDLGTPLMLQFRDTLVVQIYQSLGESTSSSFGYALVVYLSVVSIGLLLLFQVSVQSVELVTSSRAGRGPRQLRLTGLRAYLVLVLLLALLTLGVLPHIGVLLLSFSEQWLFTAVPSSFTFEHYRSVAVHPLALSSIVISLGLSLGATVLTVGLGLVIVLLLAASNRVIQSMLQALSTLPLILPGIVFAFAYATSFSGTVLDPRKNPLPLLLIAYSVRKLPVAVQLASAGFNQIHPSMREAAYLCGLSRYRTFIAITLPLMKRHILAAALLCFSFAMLEVSDSLLLAFEEQFYPVAKALYALSLRPDGVGISCALAVLVTLLTAASIALARVLLSEETE